MRFLLISARKNHTWSLDILQTKHKGMLFRPIHLCDNFCFKKSNSQWSVLLKNEVMLICLQWKACLKQFRICLSCNCFLQWKRDHKSCAETAHKEFTLRVVVKQLYTYSVPQIGTLLGLTVPLECRFLLKIERSSIIFTIKLWN